MSQGLILQEKIPQRFEGRNIRTPKRSSAANDLYLVQFEITREAWEALETIPKTALLEGVIWFHYGDAEKAGESADVSGLEKGKKEERAKEQSRSSRKSSGPFGQYWRQMFLGSWFAVPGVSEVLDCDATDESAGEALREIFQVESRAEIAPDRLELWAKENQLDNLITVSRTAQTAAARKQS